MKIQVFQHKSWLAIYVDGMLKYWGDEMSLKILYILKIQFIFDDHTKVFDKIPTIPDRIEDYEELVKAQKKELLDTKILETQQTLNALLEQRAVYGG